MFDIVLTFTVSCFVLFKVQISSLHYEPELPNDLASNSTRDLPCGSWAFHKHYHILRDGVYKLAHSEVIWKIS